MKIDWYWAGFVVALFLCMWSPWIMVGWLVGIVFGFLDDMQFRGDTLTKLENLQEELRKLEK